MSAKRSAKKRKTTKTAAPPAPALAEDAPETGRVHPALGLLVVAALFGSVLVFSAGKIANFDIWWHLSVGRQIVQTRSLASTDDLNHTHRGLEYENECWLFDLASYGLWNAGARGEALVMARIALFLATFALVFAAARRTRAPLPIVAALCYLAVVLILHRFFIRNFAVSYVFFAAYLLALTSRQAAVRDRRLLVALPVAMVFWANIHVGCVMGVILAGLYLAATAIDTKRKRADAAQVRYAALLLVLVALASGVSPYPFEWVRRMVLNLFVYPNSQAMEEIAPTYAQFPLVYWTVAGCAALALARLRRLPTFALLAIAFTGAIALRNVRFIAEFAFVMPVFVGFAIATWRTDEAVRRQLDRPLAANAAALAVAAVIVFSTARIAPDLLEFGPGPDCRTLPCGAIAFIEKARVPGPFYNRLGWGGFFTWNLYPAQRAFWDGRFKAQIGLFDAFAARPAGDVLDEHGVRFALLPFPRVLAERADMGLIGIEQTNAGRPRELGADLLRRRLRRPRPPRPGQRRADRPLRLPRPAAVAPGLRLRRRERPAGPRGAGAGPGAGAHAAARRGAAALPDRPVPPRAGRRRGRRAAVCRGDEVVSRRADLPGGAGRDAVGPGAVRRGGRAS